MPRQAGDPLDEPARRRAREEGVGQGREPAGQARPELDPREDPGGRGEPVVLDVGGLGLEHQARDVDPGRAFGPAEVAMDAEVGVLPEFLGPPEPGVDRAAGDLAEQVGLGARGGRLVTATRGRSGTSAGSARGSGRRRSCCRPGHSRGNPARASAGPGAAGDRSGIARSSHVRREAAEVAGHQVRVVADHLAGIEQIQRVEGVLDLAEDPDSFPELPAQELGPGESQAGLAGDRPPRGVDRLVDLARQGLQLGDVAGSARSRNGRMCSWPSPAWASRVQLTSCPFRMF